MRGRSIGFRLTLWYGLVVGLTLCALGIAAWFAARNSIYQTLDEELTYRLDMVVQHVKALPLHGGPVDTVRARLKSDLDLLPGNYLLQICDEAGNWLYLTEYGSRSLPACTAADSSSPPNSLQRNEPAVGGHASRYLTASIPIGEHTYVIRLGSGVEVFERGLKKLGYSLLLWIPAGLLFASAVGYWMSKRALAPVDAIITTARSISAENLSKRLVVPRTGDELQRLSRTLNEMIERLDLAFGQIDAAYQKADSAYQAVTRFTADASHELRTPVAVMRAKAEICLQRPRDEEKYRKTLRQILQELERVTCRIEDLMVLSRADSGQERLRVLPLDLKATLGEAFREAEPLAESRQIAFELDLAGGGVTIEGDEDAIRRLFLILIDNALKYTRTGGNVRVSIRVENNFAVGEVSDSGIGISEQDLPHIFERFYRADPVRSRKTGGAGLGLSIAAWIAQAHGGSIRTWSVLGEGSTFTVSLPVFGGADRGAGDENSVGAVFR